MSTHIAFELRAADGDTVWQWQPVDPLHHADPLAPIQVTFDELRVSVQEPGWYDLVLLAADDEIARPPAATDRAGRGVSGRRGERSPGDSWVPRLGTPLTRTSPAPTGRRIAPPADSPTPVMSTTGSLYSCGFVGQIRSHGSEAESG